MAGLPPALEMLLSTEPPSEDAWALFAREYSPLLLHVARSTARDRDEAMDAYTFLLEKLRENGARRLRAYTADPRSKFTTWLVVVSQRLCVDHYRARYGRTRDEESSDERCRLGLRRRIENLDGVAEFENNIPDENSSSAADELEKSELSEELRAVLASLEPADRLLISMRFDDGLSAAEIAGILRYPSQFHVYRRLNSVLAELRAALEGRGYESAAS
ncbi:MAG: sigma-70 family RNA polymerase sigma factor [Gemmatimonadales bacterium]